MSSASPVAEVGASNEVRFSVLFRIGQAEGPESRFQPRVQPLAPPIEQLREHGVHERLEMIWVARGGTAKRVPEIRNLTILETLKPDVSH
jgi:hypothetical protein